MLAAIFGCIAVSSSILIVLPGVGSTVKDSLGILQAFATVAAILLGAIFAYRNALIFRSFEPHLTVSHSVSHRAVGTQYVHIATTAVLHNSSRVRVEIREGFFQVLQIAPIEDDDIESLYRQTFSGSEDNGTVDIQWPMLYSIARANKSNTLIIEPGQSHQEPCEFIVSKYVRSVLIYSYFYNPDHSLPRQSARGWSATTVYDIVAIE